MERSSDFLVENRFVRKLKDIPQTAREFKARQKISGASGQLGYPVETSNTWDLHETLATTPPFTYRFVTFQITYTGDSSQKFPVVMPYLDLRINGTADANKLDYLYASGFNGILGYIDGSDIAFISDFTYDRTAIEDPYVQRWITGFQYQGDIEYYAKAIAMSSSGGTIELVRTA